MFGTLKGDHPPPNWVGPLEHLYIMPMDIDGLTSNHQLWDNC